MNPFVSRLLLSLLLWCGASAARADLIYLIDINTESLAGTSGYLELSLGGLADAPLASALIRTENAATLGAVAEQFGNVSGGLNDGLSNTLSMASDMGFADMLQQIAFADLLALQLQLSGDWLDSLGDAGLTFAIKLWSTDFEPLLSSSDLGELLRLELIPGGVVQIDLFSDQVSIRPLAVPAPAAWSLLLLGGLLIGASMAPMRRR